MDYDRGTMRTIAHSRGLHQLARVLQLSYFGEQCDLIHRNLDQLIENTVSAAPELAAEWQLDREPDTTVHINEEAALERAIHARWGPHSKNEESFLPVSPAIQTYQFPLKAKRADIDWGMIDLLGIGADLLPVVIELKQRNTKDTPLRMLVEAVAYAIALRDCWPSLRSDWTARMRNRAGFTGALPARLTRPAVVCLAPPEYWNRCLGRDAGEQSGRVQPEDWPAFWRLVDALEPDFTIHFAAIHADCDQRPIRVDRGVMLDLRARSGC